MPIEQYDVFFSGAIIEGHDEAMVKEKIGRIFKAKGAQLERLFSGQPIRIKGGVDLDTAVKYRVTFRDAGALVDIKPSGTPTDATTKPQPATQPPPAQPAQPATNHTEAPGETDNITLLPARTGSLIDCAEEVTPAPLPDISDLSMDRPGVTLDETEPPPPLEINTEGLSESMGSLEDCQQPVEPVELPDISELSMTAPNTGSLEDCQRQVEPVEIPDISAMEIVSPEDDITNQA